MTDRANKFIEKSNTPLWQFSDVSGRFVQDKDLAELLEKFHSQCLPTDEEILSYFGEKNDPASCYNKRLGAKWCRDFVREEPKEVPQCSDCKYTDLYMGSEPCNSCNGATHNLWQPKETLEEEIKAFDTEKYWLDELLKTTERQSEILKKLIEVKSKKK